MSNQTADLSYQCLTTVLDGLDAIVYVSDMQTYELLYINKYGREALGADTHGKPAGRRYSKTRMAPAHSAPIADC